MPFVAAAAAIAGGVISLQAANQQSKALEEQGRIQQEEANREADLQEIDNRKFESKQRLSFLKNGVTLAGSPLLVSQDTIEQGAEQVAATRARGAAQRSLTTAQARIARNQGRASLIGSVGTATSALAPAKAPAA